MKDFLSKFDKLLESKARLGIMSVLSVNDTMDYKSLKELLKLTDGNLASHITSLEKESYVKAAKSFIGKKPNTKYSITAKGRKAFIEHLEALENLLRSR